MIQNYLKIAWRNLLKHKVFSCINIAGLSVGIAACTIIFVYVQHELSYDMHNSKADRIVRVTSNLKAPDNDLVLATGPSMLTRTLKRELPEIEDGVSFTSTQLIIKHNGTLDQEDEIYKTDPSIFTIFDFDFLEGNPATALDDPNSIVISETMSKKYFGNDRALGKRIFTDTSSLMVSGVFKDRPEPRFVGHRAPDQRDRCKKSTGRIANPIIFLTHKRFCDTGTGGSNNRIAADVAGHAKMVE